MIAVEGTQTGNLADPCCQFLRRNPRLRLDQHAAEHLALGLGILESAIVGREDIRLGEEASVVMAEGDHLGALIIDLEGGPDIDLDPLLAELVDADLIDDHGIGKAQVLDATLCDFHGPADEGRGVEAGELDILEGAVSQSCLLDAEIEGDGPFHARDAADARHLDLTERYQLVDLFHLRVEDPDLRADIAHGCGGPEHQSAEDGSLLGHEQRTKGQPDHEHHVLRAVAKKHEECDAEHKKDD